MPCSRAIAVCAFLLMPLSYSQNAAPSVNRCAAAEQRQFDFWVGEWEATWPGTKEGAIQHGTNSVRRVLDECVVEENFSGGDDMHLRGKSLSIFDTRSGKWKQTWVDNEGSYLDFTGAFKDGQMILAREAVAPDGSPILQRMLWKNISPGEFDWSWESSQDNGKTWRVLWPIHYRRRK